MSAEHEWMDWMATLSDPRPALREFAIQYHFFSMHQIVAFSRALASLAPANRAALWRVSSVIADELGRRGPEEAHSAMFERFAASVGVDPKGLPAPAGRIRDEVRAYVRALDAAFASGSPAHVLGAYLFLERSAVGTYAPMLTMLRGLGIAGLDDEFFAVHSTVEPTHLEEATRLVEDHRLDATDRERMRWQEARLADRWEAFWRGIAAGCRQAVDGAVSSAGPWKSGPAFRLLCDIVASDRLVCLTGAGVSTGLERADGGGRLPDWPSLLRTLYGALGPALPDAERRDVELVLDAVWPPGRLIIEAAGMLRRADPERFDAELTRAVTPHGDATSEVHRILWEIRPRGIFTFNYDSAHEAAAAECGVTPHLLLPEASSEGAILDALGSGLAQPFLLKAHGTLGRPAEQLVLTAEAYRALVARRPAYRALVQHLLTEFHLVIVGFGLADPDFELLLNSLVDTYGAPVRESVVIRHRREEGPGEVLLRRRYGLHTLYVDRFADIPAILRDAAHQPGDRMRAALEAALRPGDTPSRGAAHAHLTTFGPAGRAAASAILRRMLGEGLAPPHEPATTFRLSELAYSLGVVTERMVRRDEIEARRANTEALMNLIDAVDRADPIARALTVLRPLLEPRDLGRVARWQARFAEPLADEARPRLRAYADYLHVYVQAKYDSEPRGGAGAVDPPGGDC